MPIHHAIDYIEFGVTEMAEAKRFYHEAFSWEFTDYSPTYAGIQGSDGEAGGFTVVDMVQCGGPLVVLYSENLEESLDAVRRAGGVIVKDVFSFPGGRRFHFHDSQGNEVAVWSDR